MPSHRFPDAWAAYEWSFEIYDVWRTGRAFDPDPDRLCGGTGVMGIVLVALDIQIIAKKHDIISGGESWFQLAFLSQNEPGRWVGEKARRLEDAIVCFCDALTEKGYLRSCNHKIGCAALKAMRK